jgi:hypothetical protein
VFGDGGDGENYLAILFKATMIARIYEDKRQPFARDNGVGSGGYRVRLQSDKIWEERSGGSRIVMEGMGWCGKLTLQKSSPLSNEEEIVLVAQHSSEKA